MAQKMFDGIIEGPGRFQPLETWERHLAELKSLAATPDFEPFRQRAIRHARSVIAMKKAWAKRATKGHAA
jgi:hypothetical protein